MNSVIFLLSATRQSKSTTCQILHFIINISYILWIIRITQNILPTNIIQETNRWLSTFVYVDCEADVDFQLSTSIVKSSWNMSDFSNLFVTNVFWSLEKGGRSKGKKRHEIL